MARKESGPVQGKSEEQGLRSEALKVSEADNSEHPGTIRDLSDKDKPDPTSIAQEQVLPD